MNTRTKGAIIIGIALVGAALLVSSHYQQTVPTVADPAMEATPTFMATSPLRQHVPVADSNNDGIPDWQELLNNTKKITLPTATSTFTPPDTLTEEFALDFFQDYFRNQSFGTFGQSPEELVVEASQRLSVRAQDQLVSSVPNRVPATPESVRQYANTVAQLISAAELPPGTRNEITIVESAVNQNDAVVLDELDPIIDNYQKLIDNLEDLAVPVTMEPAHLNFLNATIAIRNDIIALQSLYEDPILALLRLQRYEDDVRGLAVSYRDVFESAREQGATFVAGDAVYTVYTFN